MGVPARRHISWWTVGAASLCGLLLSAPTARGQGSTALSPFATAKAEALLRTKLSCLGCHQLHGEGGRLAPALDAVHQRRDPAYIAAIIRNPQQLRPGIAMPRIRMPESDLLLITSYLTGPGQVGRAGVAGSPPATSAASTSSRVDGAALYATWCAGCHGAGGAGNGPNASALPVPPANHTDRRRMSARTDAALYDIIDGGGAIMNQHVRMPAFGGTLSSAEMQALVRHLRTLCRCTGPSWSTDGPP
ncbi:MAG: c-type cytochrome [Gemmatimonadaceae bacterium]|jgi:mono/diheme cytochrome c family protein